MNIKLIPMTKEMYHTFFKEFENDIDIYLSKNDYCEYRYSEENVNKYIQKQKSLNRICLAIIFDNEIVGEIKIYDIQPYKSAVLGIALKNSKYKDRGIGTQAELLAVDYVFNVLDIPELYADSIITNTRSQHVLEKVGFKLIGESNDRKHYKIMK